VLDKDGGSGGRGRGEKNDLPCGFLPHGRANKEGVISNLMHITIILAGQLRNRAGYTKQRQRERQRKRGMEKEHGDRDSEKNLKLKKVTKERKGGKKGESKMKLTRHVQKNILNIFIKII
jgi:hypothetical protein